LTPAQKVFAGGSAEIAAIGVSRSTRENIAEFRDFEPAEK